MKNRIFQIRAMSLVTTLLAVFLIFSAPFVNAQQSKTVTLSGQLVGSPNQRVDLRDMSEMEYLAPQSNNPSIITDAQGNFKLTMKLSSPNYFRVDRALLFLSPGDNLQMHMELKHPLARTFSGTGSAANRYLVNHPPIGLGSFLYPLLIEVLTKIPDPTLHYPQRAMDSIEVYIRNREQQLDKLGGVSAEFKRLERASIKADVINTFKTLETYGDQWRYVPLLRDTAFIKVADDYPGLEAPIIKKYKTGLSIDASLLKLEAYRRIISDLIKDAPDSKNKQMIKDWFTAANLISEMQRASDKQLIAGYLPKIEAINTVAYKDVALKIYESMVKFGKGDPASSFIAYNEKGEKISLSSLKGKVIYVDMWATWCGPCMQEMPYYEKLKAKFKENPDVAFVSLSIDDDKNAWHKSIESRQVGGNQWIISRKDLDAYNVTGVPRTILIDKSFKIVDMNAPRPSDPTIIQQITALAAK